MAAVEFSRTIAIDYSGAGTPEQGCPGLRVFTASLESASSRGAREVRPPHARPHHWTRKSLAEWLVGELAHGPPALIGLDHGLSFPRAYIDAHGLPCDWSLLLEDFCAHWPTDQPGVRVRDVRRGLLGKGGERTGSARWRRQTETRARGAKSIFHFDVPGSVANSTHAGLPWVRFLLNEARAHLHVWPMEGTRPPAGQSVLSEIYPSLLREGREPIPGHTPDQRDAHASALALREMIERGRLLELLRGPKDPDDAAAMRTEGWILGV